MSDATDKHANGSATDFGDLLPLIRDEWPQVAVSALEETAGDYDQLVALIATETEHTKTLVRRQLDELRKLSGERKAKNAWLHDNELQKLREMLDRLQFKSNDVADYVRDRMAEDARKQVNQNPLVTLMMAIGLGFILGFILRGPGGRR